VNGVSSSPSWPAERFYWSVVEAPGWGRCGPLPEGVRAVFEEDAPLPGDELHAVGAPLGDGRLLVCAARRAELGALESGPDSLVPAAIPPELGARVSPERLNLLVGAFEPARFRRARQRRHLLAAAALLACAALVSVGAVRRERHWSRLAEDRVRRTADVLAGVVPGGRPELVPAELARARQVNRWCAGQAPAPDAAPILAALLKAWPVGVACKPQALTISGFAIGCSVAVEGDPALFLGALTPPAGWRLEEPRLHTAGSVTRLTISMRPAPGAPR